MPQNTPDTLGFFRNTLQKLEQAPEPTMDPVAVVDLKRILVVRIAQLEQNAVQKTKETTKFTESVKPDS